MSISHSPVLILQAAAPFWKTPSFWVSVGAALVALAALLISFWRGRLELLLKVHERFTSIEHQRARRLMHAMSREGTQVEALGPEDREQISHTLAFLDSMAIYCQRRYIPRMPLLQMWAVPVLRIMPAAEGFIAWRDAEAGPGARTWPELGWFKGIAVEYVRKKGQQGEVGEVWDAVSSEPHQTTKSTPPSPDAQEPGNGTAGPQ